MPLKEKHKQQVIHKPFISNDALPVRCVTVCLHEVYETSQLITVLTLSPLQEMKVISDTALVTKYLRYTYTQGT